MTPFVEIIIPTFNNVNQLVQCLQSIFLSTYGPVNNLLRVIVVNNGSEKISEIIPERYNLKIIEVGENLGWEGGLKRGLQESESPIVCFSNDDIRFVEGQKDWIWRMISLFNDPKVGGVGPCSNFVMGPQNIFTDNPNSIISTRFLIGFFFMLRREALNKAGGVDDTLPGGDDIDLSIRLRDAGYNLLCRRDVFVFHHGQQTGARVFEGYWNSPQMQEKTNMALIKKHGMMKFWETMIMGNYVSDVYDTKYADKDIEGEICRQFVKGEKILEVGCGGRKTVENSVGVDLHGAGENIPFVTEGKDKCLADIKADASTDIPVPYSSQDTIIARHILEHCQDTLGTLSLWNRILKVGGRLIIAVPNNGLGNTFMMNPEHIASFVPTSLEKLGEASGFKKIFSETNVNGVSFVMVFEKEVSPSFPNAKPSVMPKAAQLMEVV